LRLGLGFFALLFSRVSVSSFRIRLFLGIPSFLGCPLFR
jgi:hypothetical protein